jgi:hypothetical protein
MISFDSAGGPTVRQTFILGLSTTVDLCTDQQTITVDPASIGCLP